MALEVMLAYVALVFVDSFDDKFGYKWPGSFIAVGALTRFISCVSMLLGAFKVGENVPAGGTLIRDYQPFGRVIQSVSDPFMLA